MYKIIAHRGYHNKTIKENTYLAISKALNNKNIIGIEIDIHLTSDNKIVVIHDHLLERTSNGNGIVEDMTLNEIKKYNFGTTNFYQTIPTLDKILEIKTNKIILIEIKCRSNNEKKFANILNNYIKGNNNNIYFISFNKKVLNYLDKRFKKGHITIKKFDNKYNILIQNKLFFKKYNGNYQCFLYTINNYNELKDSKIYYICDNLDEILKKI
jgi:glycerophosphoryl diester phosphodiesterase